MFAYPCALRASSPECCRLSVCVAGIPFWPAHFVALARAAHDNKSGFALLILSRVRLRIFSVMQVLRLKRIALSFLSVFNKSGGTPDTEPCSFADLPGDASLRLNENRAFVPIVFHTCRPRRRCWRGATRTRWWRRHSVCCDSSADGVCMCVRVWLFGAESLDRSVCVRVWASRVALVTLLIAACVPCSGRWFEL